MDGSLLYDWWTGKNRFWKSTKSAAKWRAFYWFFFLDTLVNTTKTYVLSQIEAGAEVIQLFDSQAKDCCGESFECCVLEPTRRLVSFIKQKHPEVPHYWLRAAYLWLHIRNTRTNGVDAVSIDPDIDLDFALHHFGGKITKAIWIHCF